MPGCTCSITRLPARPDIAKSSRPNNAVAQACSSKVFWVFLMFFQLVDIAFAVFTCSSIVAAAAERSLKRSSKVFLVAAAAARSRAQSRARSQKRSSKVFCVLYFYSWLTLHLPVLHVAATGNTAAQLPPRRRGPAIGPGKSPGGGRKPVPKIRTQPDKSFRRANTGTEKSEARKFR